MDKGGFYEKKICMKLCANVVEKNYINEEPNCYVVVLVTYQPLKWWYLEKINYVGKLCLLNTYLLVMTCKKLLLYNVYGIIFKSIQYIML